jgi:hypothetical protein
VQDKLLSANDTKLEYINSCQNLFNSQDPYNKAIKLLTTVCGSKLKHNNAINSSPKEDTNFIKSPQLATAAVIYQKSDGQSATLARSLLTIPALDDPEMPNNKQEWEVCDIISKEDVDGVLHY